MPKKISQSDVPPRAVAPDNQVAGPPLEIAELLSKTDQLLKDGEPGKALDGLARAKSTSSWLANAKGVCQLRLGNQKVAVDVFRSLVLGTGGILLRKDVPAVFKTNYAVALLLSDNMSGCQSVLAEMREVDHAAVARLNVAIRRWRDSLTFWERINWYLGGQPARPVDLIFPPGDLE